MSKPDLPTEDETDEFFLSCRYGEPDEVQQFVDKFGSEVVGTFSDDNGNTVLHMICGNGHDDLLDYLLPLVPASVISAQNQAGSTPLHWAALNAHLSIAKKLVQFPGGPGVKLIDIKTKSGRTPLGEAEMAGWEEGAKWFVEVMNLDDDASAAPADEAEGEELQVDGQDIEVEIEDADGQIAKLSISKDELNVGQAVGS